MKKRWMFAVLLTGIIALGVAGGAALAHGDRNNGGPNSSGFPLGGGALLHGSGDSGQSRLGGLASRVAAILELEEQQVQDAFHQAVREMREERAQQKLDRAVQAGKMTQEEADEFMEWFLSRPETFASGVALQRFREPGLNRRNKHSGHWGPATGLKKAPAGELSPES